MPDITDQTGRTVSVSSFPRRIVSLVPSQTELLADLGLEEEVVGITKFCVHPEAWFRSKTRVGGTKQLNPVVIDSLQPDLIIANKEENVKEQVEALAARYPVWISDVNNLEDAYQMIGQIGSMINRKQEAENLVSRIKENFSLLPTKDSRLTTPDSRLTTCYLIWQNPLMTVGGDTFIHSMLDAAGFSNIFEDRKRYPEITPEELKAKQPRLLLLSSEPYPFKQEQADSLQKELPGTKILLVDGELFSWYGSRLQYSPAYFKELHDQLK